MIEDRSANKKQQIKYNNKIDCIDCTCVVKGVTKELFLKSTIKVFQENPSFS